MSSASEIKGNNNISIQGVKDGTIIVQVDGETKEILKELEALKDLLGKQQTATFNTPDKVYDINTLSKENFGFLMSYLGRNSNLPVELSDNIILPEKNKWALSLKQGLLKEKVSVGNRPMEIFQHYGWLIETFLQKMGTAVGKERTLRAFSFMTEAYQSSIRYLSYIQLSQLLGSNNLRNIDTLSSFINLEAKDHGQFDFLNYILVLNQVIRKQDTSFVSELDEFVEILFDKESDLYSVAVFLENHRNRLVRNEIVEEDLNELVNEYLTALIYWLRQLAFLANYRLVSIKNIVLSYRLGTKQRFLHHYGELHGLYGELIMEQGEGDFQSYSIDESFTFNQSILLFKGNNIASSLSNIKDPSTYLSLSPLIIDRSVYSDSATQTPEIYYYLGRENRRYKYAQYKNELPVGTTDYIGSNKFLNLKKEDINQPKLNELYEDIELVFQFYR